jgi:hypothetical protein
MPTKPRHALPTGRAMHGAMAQPPARSGTRSLTAHVAEDIHQAVRDLAKREHLTLDEILHLAFALLLNKNNCPLPPSLDLKLKHRRLTAYLAPPQSH